MSAVAENGRSSPRLYAARLADDRENVLAHAAPRAILWL